MWDLKRFFMGREQYKAENCEQSTMKGERSIGKAAEFDTFTNFFKYFKFLIPQISFLRNAAACGI